MNLYLSSSCPGPGPRSSGPDSPQPESGNVWLFAPSSQLLPAKCKTRHSNRNQQHPQQTALRTLKIYQTAIICINDFINSGESCRFQNVAEVHQNISVPQNSFCVGPAVGNRMHGKQGVLDNTDSIMEQEHYLVLTNKY